MRSLTIPLDDLPLREELPADLVEDGGELWQRGARLVDRSVPGHGRITAGSWLSGRFETKPFVFGGCEWLFVLSGRIVFIIEGQQYEIRRGMSALIPRGLSCRWVQPEPVLKYFLRWDHDGDDQPQRFWSSAMLGVDAPRGVFSISAGEASWRQGTSFVTLLTRAGHLELAGVFCALGA
ncbi:cupin domain-containing protein [Aquamicrobium sp. LC103]|uniref:cupin domain-containing protein n=1 Tax=Aquamicrobium sp. LC103 TaxID=1120658 RepID=UPI00063E75B6|nr:cupin domain-containing protein [Aquamicrobium sp. LC103]TKT74459.1 cupin domain-containing protein [Aquamicrobium sp. LC103]